MKKLRSRVRKVAPRSSYGPALLIVLLTLAVYIPVLGAGFIWDDDAHVTQNPTLRDADGLYRIWFEVGATQQYYPLVFTSFWIESRLWGLEPRGFHLVNILLHAISAILVWRVLIRLEIPWALLVAIIFAIHPLHVESVAWISERKNVLSGVFYLASLLTYIRFFPMKNAGNDTSESWRFYGFSLFLFICALLSKTVTSSLPAVILLLIWWKRHSLTFRRVLPLLPMFVIGMGMGLLTAWVERQYIGAQGADWSFSFLERCLIAGRALWHYAGKLFYPVNLTFSYPRWMIDAGVWWQYLFPLGVITVLTILWIMRGRIGRGPLVSILIFSGTLFPALGFVNTYPMRYSFVADHFAYLASISLITLFVVCLFRYFQFEKNTGRGTGKKGRSKSSDIVFISVTAALIIILAPLTWKQGKIYRNSETLYADVLAGNPTSWMAHHNLAREFLARGRLREATAHFAEALHLRPDSAEIQSGLGTALGRQGKLDEAFHHLEAALKISPDDDQIHTNLGITLAAKGNLEAAIQHYRRALKINSRSSVARNNLAIALYQTGRVEEAIQNFDLALRQNPANAETHYNLAILLEQQGRLDDAIKHHTRAIAIQPTFVEARHNLGLILLKKGQLDRAIQTFRAVLRIDPDHSGARSALKQALAGQ